MPPVLALLRRLRPRSAACWLPGSRIRAAEVLGHSRPRGLHQQRLQESGYRTARWKDRKPNGANESIAFIKQRRSRTASVEPMIAPVSSSVGRLLSSAPPVGYGPQADGDAIDNLIVWATAVPAQPDLCRQWRAGRPRLDPRRGTLTLPINTAVEARQSNEVYLPRIRQGQGRTLSTRHKNAIP
jgi:hypothetical protein